MNRYIKSFFFYFIICYTLTSIGFIYINMFLWVVSEGFLENAHMLLSIPLYSFAVLFVPSALFAFFGTLLNPIFANAKLSAQILLTLLVTLFSTYLAIPFTGTLSYVCIYITEPSYLMDMSLEGHIDYVMDKIGSYMHPLGFLFLLFIMFTAFPNNIVLITGIFVSFYTLRYGSRRFSKPMN